MLTETDEVVMMEAEEDFAATLIGGIWVDFKASIPDLQAKILTDGFNLILLNLPESLLQNVITEIIVDETFDTPIKKKQIYELITNNIIDVLSRLGFIINLDEVTHERLEELIHVGNFFHEMDQYEDVIGLGNILDSVDIPPVDRFLLIFQKYMGDSVSLVNYELLLQDVSEVTLKAVRDNLLTGDVEDGIPINIIKRVRANRALIENTLAYEHVTNNGRVGSPVDTLLGFFRVDLVKLLDYPSMDNQVLYGKEVMALYLISELNNDTLREQLLVLINEITTDHLALLAIEKMIGMLDLTNE
jgi:hypothetical protein